MQANNKKTIMSQLKTLFDNLSDSKLQQITDEFYDFISQVSHLRRSLSPVAAIVTSNILYNPNVKLITIINRRSLQFNGLEIMNLEQELQQLEEYFKYHPPKTPERQRRHEVVNKAALDFAKAVVESVWDEETKKYAIFAIQQARMFANQGITIDELAADREQG